jgi:hypothetical protein
MNPLVVTQEHDQKSLTATVGRQVQVKLPKGMEWSDIQVSGEDETNPVLQRIDVATASTIAADDAANAVFVAARAGTVSLSAHGRARSPPGQARPHFMVAWHTSIVVR